MAWVNLKVDLSQNILNTGCNMNKYLEKIAEQVGYEQIAGTPGQLLTTGVFGLNHRLKQHGYNSSLAKSYGTMLEANGSITDQAKNFGKHLVAPMMAC